MIFRKYKYNVLNFINSSYKSNPLAFYCEMFEAVFLLTASAILTFTILDPATKYFVPIYFLGSIFGIISGIYRNAFFVVILCSWFAVMHFIAIVKLFIL